MLIPVTLVTSIKFFAFQREMSFFSRLIYSREQMRPALAFATVQGRATLTLRPRRGRVDLPLTSL